MANTLILGASHKPHRFSYKAMLKLRIHAIPFLLVAAKPFEVDGLPVTTLEQVDKDVDTVALYVNPQRLKSMVDQVIRLKPRRIIFNPGTESVELEEIFQNAGIDCVEDCVLRMLDGNRY